MQTQTQTRWPGFGYVPVRGLADRLIARQLRTARKNMTRFFRERGMFEFVERMERIRKSNQGMMEKNRNFQKVLDDYAQRVNPQPAPAANTSEAADHEARGSSEVAVQNNTAAAELDGDDGVVDPSRTGPDAAGSVPVVEEPDAGLVIEE